MKVDTVSPTVNVRTGYVPTSPTEALRMTRYGYGDILDTTVLDAAKAVDKAHRDLWEAQRELRKVIRTRDM